MIRGLLVAALLAPSPALAGTYVLVVGHNHSPDPAQPALRYADDDAGRYFELLSPSADEAHLLVSFDAESQEIFEGLVPRARPPTRAHLDRVVGALSARIADDERATLYVVYTGHGDVEDGEGYVHLADGRLTRTRLRDILAKLGAHRTHLIVDACKSYFLVAGRGPGGRRAAFRRPFALPEALPGVGYILSTSTAAESHEWAAWRSGLFSHQVRSALLGAADADADGAVDYSELAAFVAVANEAIPSPLYRPGVFIRPPTDDRAATVFTPGDARSPDRLLIEPAATGRLEVTDQRGLRFADTHKAAGQPLRLLLLPPWRYDVRWRGESFTVEPGAGPVRLAELESTGVWVAQRGEAHRAFQHAFAVPFGQDVARGFRLGRDTAPPAVLGAVGAPTRTDPWVVGLLTGAGLAIAGGAALTAGAVQAAEQGSTAAQSRRQALAEDEAAFTNGAVAAYSVGVVAVGVALYLYFSDR